MTSTLATLTACPAGHQLHYPAMLEDVANASNQEVAFCSMCECGTVYFVVVWPGDGARVMASGDTDLFRRFEATGWPETTMGDSNGVFFVRAVPHPLDIALFTRHA